MSGHCGTHPKVLLMVFRYGISCVKYRFHDIKYHLYVDPVTLFDV
jgi:hypothetical protein